jgi:hypothetical protein
MSKPSLLGTLMNFGKSDIVQSVTPGGADAAIDYRGVSSYIKTQRTSYIVTSQDISNNFIVVSVVWPTPFADANYTVVMSLEDVSGKPPAAADFFQNDIHDKTAAGFLGIFDTGGDSQAGDECIIHAIAIHD